MKSSLVTVPDDLSYVNAFHALWSQSRPAVYFEGRPDKLKQHEETISTSEKIVQFFKNLNDYYVDYAGGRLIKTDFSHFPELNIYWYDQAYGIGSAQKALSHYHNIPSNKRLDRYDSCSFSEIQKKLISKL
ncbi:MAG: hypothetical protein Q8K60_07085 [Parachlamydiaceae bacterium]|nr:hypothetical protein [Parachlamydiaceae bacterium]